ncbi:hypothetical protein MRB53_042266 [Persea americana]|nr:hypothetical protein MRB53_042266 [Persea americana]
MYSLPLFPRQLSFTTLLDLSEKQDKPEDLTASEGATFNACPRVAVIGAGITGVASAAHILDAGFECHIFEGGDERSVGGIWTRVNETSSLQIHSGFYCFHPSVSWKSDYPKRAEILGEVQKVWERYDLSKRTTFRCRVNNIYRENGKWVVNDPSNGYLQSNALTNARDSNLPAIPNQDDFEGNILHSSMLATQDMKNKNVLIVGGGASAVEALEYACDRGAASVKSEKWFIPRIPMLNAALATTIGDKYGVFARVLEFSIRKFFYRDLWHLAPPHDTKMDGIYGGTPVCNSRLFDLVVSSLAEMCARARPSGYVVMCRPSHPTGLSSRGASAAPTTATPARSRTKRAMCASSPPASVARSFPSCRRVRSGKRYRAPNWYLQCFPTDDATICATNCTWKDGIGTVGGGHIGVYTRFLLVFLMDSRTKPSPWMMRTWVDTVHLLKRPCPGGALAFVTSAEIFFWMFMMILLQPSLWAYASFIMMGPSVAAGSSRAASLRT